jgi:hypothetical protein
VTGDRRNWGFGSEFAVLLSIGEIICVGRIVIEIMTIEKERIVLRNTKYLMIGQIQKFREVVIKRVVVCRGLYRSVVQQFSHNAIPNLSE